MSRLACKGYLETIGKSKWHFNISIERLKGLINTSGHLMTLAISLGLWYGIYAALGVTVLDNQVNNVEERFVDEKIVAK